MSDSETNSPTSPSTASCISRKRSRAEEAVDEAAQKAQDELTQQQKQEKLKQRRREAYNKKRDKALRDQYQKCDDRHQAELVRISQTLPIEDRPRLRNEEEMKWTKERKEIQRKETVRAAIVRRRESQYQSVPAADTSSTKNKSEPLEPTQSSTSLSTTQVAFAALSDAVRRQIDEKEQASQLKAD